MSRLWRCLYAVLCVCCTLVFGAVGYFYFSVPSAFTVTAGDSVAVGEWLSVARGIEKSPDGNDVSVTLHTPSTMQGEYTAPLRLFGVVPVKPVSVSVVDRPIVAVCGTPFGIKLYTDGVLVVGMSDVQTAVGGVNPSAAAGIRIGDAILSVDGKVVATNEDVATCINACDGRSVTMRIRRDGVEFDAQVTPVRPLNGEGYRAGLWVRDSTAGVGMLTFYDEDTGAYAGLGHPVTDADTGQILPISGGEIVPSRILDVKKSQKGAPGELCGAFESGSLGRLELNATSGLYGTLTAFPQESVRLPLAMKQEVAEGAAQIYTTVDGTEPKLYDIEIEQVRYTAANDTRSMVIRVTDETLLSLTGGIVQGMSGSPIIQDGKLVGAVTHVLVNDPSRGYAVFAETMLETAQSVAENNKLKEAS